MEGIIDVHCHIIPGVDDGVRSFEECRELLEMEYAQGVRTIIATPHFRRTMFETPLDKIKEQYEEVKMLAKDIGTGIEVILGCEYYTDLDMIDNLNSKARPTIGDTAFVLVEFSENVKFALMRARIYELICNGYEPIVAHIERYKILIEEIAYVEELIALGAKMQLNAQSIIGSEGWKVKRFCKRMMREDYLYVVGSDAHDIDRRPPYMGRCAAYMEKKMGRDYVQKIMIENPQNILGKIKEAN
jgi:Capsular polysaccharide biosynthesis protein